MPAAPQASALTAEGRTLLQSPPVAAEYPCASGNATCFCLWKHEAGLFADVAVGCTVREDLPNLCSS